MNRIYLIALCVLIASPSFASDTQFASDFEPLGQGRVLKQPIFKVDGIPVLRYIPKGKAPYWYEDQSRDRVDHVTGKQIDCNWIGPRVTPSILGSTHSAGTKELYESYQQNNLTQQQYTNKLLTEALTVFDEDGIGCHYLVHTDGTIYSLLPEAYRAYWAGESFWPSIDNKFGEGPLYWCNDVNSHSLSVMIVNGAFDREDKTIQHFDLPEPQVNSLLALSRHLAHRYPNIESKNVVRYSDVKRGVVEGFEGKQIPGPNFPMEEIRKLFKGEDSSAEK